MHTIHVALFAGTSPAHPNTIGLSHVGNFLNDISAAQTSPQEHRHCPCINSCPRRGTGHIGIETLVGCHCPVLDTHCPTSHGCACAVHQHPKPQSKLHTGRPAMHHPPPHGGTRCCCPACGTAPPLLPSLARHRLHACTAHCDHCCRCSLFFTCVSAGVAVRGACGGGGNVSWAEGLACRRGRGSGL